MMNKTVNPIRSLFLIDKWEWVSIILRRVINTANFHTREPLYVFDIVYTMSPLTYVLVKQKNKKNYFSKKKIFYIKSMKKSLSE